MDIFSIAKYFKIKTAQLHSSPSHIPDKIKIAIIAELNNRLADSLDLYSQIKTAHWNIKGPLFAELHPLFDTFAVDLITFIDNLAERNVILGGTAKGTIKQACENSNIPDYPTELSTDLKHVAALIVAFDAFLSGMHSTRKKVKNIDDDTFDLLTEIIRAFEKHAWFLHASIKNNA